MTLEFAFPLEFIYWRSLLIATFFFSCLTAEPDQESPAMILRWLPGAGDWPCPVNQFCCMNSFSTKNLAQWYQWRPFDTKKGIQRTIFACDNLSSYFFSQPPTSGLNKTVSAHISGNRPSLLVVVIDSGVSPWSYVHSTQLHYCGV